MSPFLLGFKTQKGTTRLASGGFGEVRVMLTGLLKYVNIEKLTVPRFDKKVKVMTWTWTWPMSATILACLLFYLRYMTAGWAVIGAFNGTEAGYRFSNLQYNQLSIDYPISPESAQAAETLGLEMRILLYAHTSLAVGAVGVVITSEFLLRRRNQ